MKTKLVIGGIAVAALLAATVASGSAVPFHKRLKIKLAARSPPRPPPLLLRRRTH